MHLPLPFWGGGRGWGKNIEYGTAFSPDDLQS